MGRLIKGASCGGPVGVAGQLVCQLGCVWLRIPFDVPVQLPCVMWCGQVLDGIIVKCS